MNYVSYKTICWRILLQARSFVAAQACVNCVGQPRAGVNVAEPESFTTIT